jgi:hypothetical protein
MKIHNIRMGLATNSSSTHSLIFMSPANYKNTGTDEYGDFGWSFFTAANKTSKENYLGYILKNNLEHVMGPQNAAVIMASMFPSRGKDFANELDRSGYGIDHQSMMTLPVNWNGKGIDLDFFKAFRDYIIKSPIAILGGNDNDDSAHPLSGSGVHVDMGLPEDYGYGDAAGLVARNDGDHWVVFNRNSGAKVRLSFSSKTGKITEANKGKTPELVDIKITDYCPFGCPFCYQGSTTAEVHADRYKVSNIAYALAKMKVFEVAIGGGEPTLHPHFIEILDSFHHQNIVPNFTTKNLAWLKDDKIRPQILERCGAFAYSVHNREDVAKLNELLETNKLRNDWAYGHSKVSVQYVLESGGDLYGVLDEAKKNYIRVTLLGFKTTGFGKDFPTVPENWIETVQKVQSENGWLNLGVDTAIIQKYGPRIKEELKVREELMTAEEGKFSMYIDAVSQRMAPSSYCDENLYVPYSKDISPAEIETAFQQW